MSTQNSQQRPWLQLKRPMLLLIVLSTSAMLSAVALVSTSVWFLSMVTVMGLSPLALSYNFHHPAAFIRLFALLRVAAKFAERSFGHRIALSEQSRMRAQLFTRFLEAPALLRSSWQLARDETLQLFLEDVESLDFWRLRVWLPALTLALLVVLGLLISAVLFWQLALLVLVVLILLALLARAQYSLFRAAMRAQNQAKQHSATLGSDILSARVPLRGSSQAFAHARAPYLEQLASIHAQAARLGFWLDLLPALYFAAGVTVLAAILGLALLGAQDVQTSLFLGFGWYVLLESIAMSCLMIQAQLLKNLAQDNLDAAFSAPLSSALQSELDALEPRYKALATQLQQLAQGQSLSLWGASGAGKTLLLKQVAGWLSTDNPSEIQRTAASEQLCFVLHDCHVFADTWRQNLLSNAAISAEQDAQADARMWAALEQVELDTRVKASGGLDSWLQGNSALSMGEAQRLGLARMLLSTANLVIIDEPCEHLPPEQAVRIFARILEQLGTKRLLFSTHNPALLAMADKQLRLD